MIENFENKWFNTRQILMNETLQTDEILLLSTKSKRF